MRQLSDDQKDVLAEIFNMGMGKATNALSNIAGNDKEIHFNLPKLTLVSIEDFLKRFKEKKSKSFILQRYSGDISGTALMFYPSTEDSKFAALLIDSELPVEEIVRLESDALIEIGNIFINAALSCLTDFLEIEISTHIPELLYQDSISNDLFQGETAVEIEAGFDIEHIGIKGEIAFVINNKTLDLLMDTINKMT